jgi:hypothetical protein
MVLQRVGSVGMVSSFRAKKAGSGLQDKNDPVFDPGVGEVTNNLSWTLYFFKDVFDKVHPLMSQRLTQEIIRKFIKVSDRSLSRYWPNGLTSIKLEVINPGLKGSQTVIFAKSS